MWHLLPLLLVGEAQAAPQCPGYSCAEPGYHLGKYETQPICMNMTSSGDYWMTICDNFGNGFGCVVSGSNSYPSVCGEIPVPPADSSYPGEPCSVEQDCIGNSTVICIDNICTGQQEGYECAQDYDCGMGLYCDLSPEANGRCAFQLSEDDSCTRDEECVNFLGCTGMPTPTGSITGTCEPYFSLPVGSVVLNCVEDDGEWFNKLCASGVCWPDKAGTNGPGVCVAAFTSTSNLPVSCTSDSQCTGTSGKLTATKTCTCGKSPTGTSYCPAFSGDQPSINLQQHYTNLLKFNMSECHTSRRFSDFCFEYYLPTQEFSEYLTDVKLVAGYPSYIDNDNCAKVILLNDFYEISQADLQCKAYSCGQLESGQCAIFNEGNNTYQLRQCDEQNVCDVEGIGSDNVTCTVPISPTSYLYPGDSCTANSQCISNNCASGVCKGLASGTACADPSSCDVGLSCINFACSSLVAVSGNCIADTDCVLNAGCNLTVPTTYTGICVPYFSIATGSPVYCPSSGLQPLCSSGWCQQLHGLPTGTCVATPKSPSLPRACQASSQCTDTTGTYTTECVCGYNPTGTQYCELFPGDLPYQDYLKDVKSALSKGNSINKVCQTSRRFQGDCMANLQKVVKKKKDSHWLTRSFYYAMLYPQLQENEECVKEIFTNQYWSIPAKKKLLLDNSE